MEPEILIGIPTLNGPERLGRCLESVRKYTDLDRHLAKVLVSDDCSFESNLELNKRIASNYGLEMLMAETRVGVAEQWNRITRHTRAPIIILMNDDVEVVPDWLQTLVFSIRQNPHAGMIGLKAFQGVNTKHFTPPPVPSYNEAVMERGVGMMSSTGFLFGFFRDKWEAVDGFDTGFFAFYEEIDFGIRLFRKDWPSYMLSYPVVIHQGGATTSDFKNINAQKTIDRSRARFKEKHGSIETVRGSMIEKAWPKPVQWNTMLDTWVD